MTPGTISGSNRSEASNQNGGYSTIVTYVRSGHDPYIAPNTCVGDFRLYFPTLAYKAMEHQAF